MIARDWTVIRLAEHWGCSTKHVYSLIRCGDLNAYRIGRRKGIRITDEARQACEGRNQITATATSASDDEVTRRLLSTATLKALAAA